MYRAFALLQPSCNLTLTVLAGRLRERFPSLQVDHNGNEITLTGNNWDYHLLLVSGPDVKAESEGFAERIAGVEDGAEFAACDRRIEVWSDTPDPFMEHFDDHFQVLDVLRGCKGVILIDPSEPGLL
jgi:hypothetical protein